MSRLVMKFGGTSVGDVERIRRVARLVSAERQAGHGIAVVVSAMSGETNRLVELSRQAGEGLPPELFDDEYDVVVATGEQVTTGLLALALRSMGIPARSWQGWQIRVASSSAHGSARISDIDADEVAAAIDAGEVAVIPGFQGVTEEDRITTLGRGGSDTSAVAVAAALRAERCDIYTDVDGVYTTDPRMVPKAQRLEKISYEEMLEMASLGAKVLQTRSVELAMAKRVPVRVLSSFVEPGEPNPGTLVCDEDEIVEKQIVSGIAYSRDEAKVSLKALQDHPGVAADIFGRLAEANINVDMIVQAPSRTEGAVNMTFTVPEREADRAMALMSAAQEQIGFEQVEVKKDVSKVSVIGVGMRSHVGVARIMFDALSKKGINIENIATSEIKISVLIDSSYTELAVRALHTAYGLDAA
ncbi:MAG: aspartate kinase [Hyphomonadaceae bacterium]|jgi:aspartate kinase|uniref:aspartate kinase n=1 Tax=Aquidulcibacter sp. TaxID=2052990 RepID=UPI0022C887C6|nr:aspartate kinase [Aquidulcibacter sp.]MCE2891213.1 aspartate kinase [Hyphomonadaceae bacterium]MCZ8206637.1 aspartate kinase [Aquidulcibacter sp.]